MSYKHLTHEDRLNLSAFLRAGLKLKEIASLLNKDPSTITRELQRNSTDNKSGYDARKAKESTAERRTEANQRFRKITKESWLDRYIRKKLKKYWSPEQIAGRLEKDYGMTIICHETIYQYIYNECPALKKYLRCKKGKYRRRYGTRIREEQREALKKKRIDTRPEVVETRERVGDWEGDTVRGKDNDGTIITHVERKSGYFIADKIERALADIVSDKIVKRFESIAKGKKKTITYDNGSEFAEHEFIEKMTEMAVYFAYPYHSWERGSNENTNGLLRFFFPKKSSFKHITQEKLDKAVQLINSRPRKRLGYLTPNEVFKENCTLN